MSDDSGNPKKPSTAASSGAASPTAKSRSVVDYDTEDALRKALMAVVPDPVENSDNTAQVNNETGSSGVCTSLDWVLPNYDPESTEVQSMKEELHRLKVLKSYLILDAEREEAFDRITGLAARIFNVPIAVISLVDLGRQWFMSTQGLGDVRETPRKLAFCAHAILNKNNIFVIPDASKDFRFKENPLVTGPPNIRFYAGAPLLSPEGYKLGTVCIISPEPRPGGLTEDEQASLHDLADMAVKAMVDRRYQLQTQEHPAQLIAYTAHDLMTPLTGVQLSLSLLKDDQDLQRVLGVHQLELLKTAANCSDLMLRICETVMGTLRQENSTTSSTAPTDLMSMSMRQTPEQQQQQVPVVKMSELVNSLLMIMEPIPKQVPLIITLDPAVPSTILSDDLKLFRSALNLLSHATARTELGYVHLKISCKDDDAILFECENTGTDVPVEEYPYLFQPSQTEDGLLHLGLSSVASLISSLNGEYGFRPRGVTMSGEESAVPVHGRRNGSIFWFSVPLFLPGTSDKKKSPPFSKMANPLKLPVIPLIRRTGSCGSMSRTGSRDSVRSARSRDAGMMLGTSNSGCCLDQVVNEPSVLDRKLPAQQRPPVEEPVPAAVAAVRQRRALVIDDSLVVRKSLSFALKKFGYEVHQAVNGMEGLKCLKEHLYDLTLLDFLMPVMDGTDCARQYRAWETKHRSWFRQLIIGISAHASANDSGEGIKAGMDMFQPKPISIKTLTELQDNDLVVSHSQMLDGLEGLSSKYSGTNVASATVVDGEPERPPSVAASQKRPAVRPPSPPHRRRKLSGMVESELDVPVCLFATDTPTIKSNEVLTKLEVKGWKVVVVHDGTDAFRLLQMRQWDCVLVDDDLPLLAGTPCVDRFRKWEQQNRVHKQRNIFLVCDGGIPSPFDKSSVVQPPQCIDGVLRKPVEWKELEYLTLRNKKEHAFDIVVRKTEKAAPAS